MIFISNKQCSFTIFDYKKKYVFFILILFIIKNRCVMLEWVNCHLLFVLYSVDNSMKIFVDRLVSVE